MNKLAQRILAAITQHKPEGGYIRIDTMMFLIDQDFPSFEAFDKAVKDLVLSGDLTWVPFKGYRFVGAPQLFKSTQKEQEG